MAPKRILWTNKSVLKFAGDADPVSLIEAKARALVLKARDAGWSGPPYNPLAIADLLRIPVEANSEVGDARAVASSEGIKIEFNPTQPRERVRFSLAHEIAHTLFSDVADQTRHRSGPTTEADDWQLEMLCNLAAAEIVMPTGSLPPSEKLPRLEQLMVDRRKFDVSAEAFLIRVVKTTAEPALMFCASPIESGASRHHYRIDYSVASKSASTVIGPGTSVPVESVIYRCTAIGQTNRAEESWITEKKLGVECVGIPGYPGTLLPRVAGIVRFQGQDAEQDALTFLHGNVLGPVGAGQKVVCQLVNNQARVWGGGVARAAAQKYPLAQQDFSHWLPRIPKKGRLGQVHFVAVDDEITIASLVAQEGYGASLTPRIRYAALEQAFASVAQFARAHAASVHCPRIGAGQSGGAWDTIEEIIRDTLTAKGVRVTIYDLPPRRQSTRTEFLI